MGLPRDSSDSASNNNMINRLPSLGSNSNVASNDPLRADGNIDSHREDYDMYDDNILMDEGKSKRDIDSGIYSGGAFQTFRTITTYIISDIHKKQRSFKIGVFTIILVVTFIMMLKSLIDVSPIAFLKVGQDQVGLFDYVITSNYGDPFEDGDVSSYDTDPFSYNNKIPTTTNFFEGLVDNSFVDKGDHA